MFSVFGRSRGRSRGLIRPSTSSQSEFVISEVVGIDGFSNNSYFAQPDGTTLRAQNEMVTTIMLTINAIPAGNERLFGVNDGTPDWSHTFAGSFPRLQYRDQSTAALSALLDDTAVGKTFIALATKNGDEALYYVYNVSEDRAIPTDLDTTIGATVTSSVAAAIGAANGDTGGTGADSVTIIGCGFGTQFLTKEQVTDFFRQCRISGTISEGMPGMTHCYQAKTDHQDSLGRDLIGTAHFTKVEQTAGDLDVTSSYSPTYENSGSFRWFMAVGQSNLRGALPTSSVPTIPIDFTSSYAPCNYFELQNSTWTALAPKDNNDWGPELSIGRQLVTNGETEPWLFRYGASGTSLSEEWSLTGAARVAVHEKLIDGSTLTPHVIPPFADRQLAAVYWVQGEADAQVLAEADSYESNLSDFIDWIGDTYNTSSDFKFIAALIPSFSTVQYRTTVNTAMINQSVSRSFVYIVNTDNLTDFDGSHFTSGSLISLGFALEDARFSGSNVSASAPTYSIP